MRNGKEEPKTVTQFRDLVVWQNARELANDVYRITSSGPLSREPVLRYQMRRCALSVVSNIAEGFERDGNREFVQFLSIAKGSLGELRAQMMIAADQAFIDLNWSRSFDKHADRVAHLIGGLIRYLRSSGIKGKKFDTGQLH